MVHKHKKDEDDFNCKCRRATGYLSGLLAVTLTIIVGLKAWKDTTRIETAGRNTSERVDVQEAVEKSDNYPCAVTDEAGKIVQWNYAMQNLTGADLQTAEKLGIDAFICGEDSIKKVKEALYESFNDPESEGKVLLIPCSIKNIANQSCTPVHMSVRLEPSKTTGKKFAVTRVDKESQIVEFTTNGERHLSDEHSEAAKAAE